MGPNAGELMAQMRQQRDEWRETAIVLLRRCADGAAVIPDEERLAAKSCSVVRQRNTVLRTTTIVASPAKAKPLRRR
jgi:exoribonuclease II